MPDSCAVNLLLLFLAVSFSGVVLAQNNMATQGAIKLYVSKQTGEKTTFSGFYEKQTDKYEEGDVSIFTLGPVNYTVTPGALAIQPNEYKKWNGTIAPDVDSAGKPGTTVIAQLVADYDIKYSRAYGESSGGTVISTYSCSDNAPSGSSGSSGTGCQKHNGVPGTHEMVNETGRKSKEIEVVSILADLSDTICLGKLGKGPAAGTFIPEKGGTYLWTSLHPKVTIENPTAENPIITILDTSIHNAKVKVKYDIDGVTYTDEAIVNNCECSCETIKTGVVAFGDLNVTFGGELPPDNNGAVDKEGNCRYTVNNAGVKFKMLGVIERDVKIDLGATVAFGRNCKTKKLSDVYVSWKGDAPIKEIKYKDISILMLSVTEVDMKVDKDKKVSGKVSVKVTNTEDRDLTINKGFVMLRKGINSTITFTFNNEEGFKGEFDFSGLQDIKIDLEKKGDDGPVTIASFEGNMDKDGLLKGDFAAQVEASYKTNAFKVTLKKLSLGVELSIKDASFKLTKGNGKVQLSEMKKVKGTIDLGLDFPGNGGCTATVEASEISALSMKVEDFKLAIDFDANFDMTKIQGTLKVTHAQLPDAKLDVKDFIVENGELTTLSISGEAEYKAFKFMLEKSEYVKEPTSITVTAKVELDATGVKAGVKVEGFTIKEDGSITVGKIEGGFTKAPASFTFKAEFGEKSFAGSFNGDFAAIGLSGSIDVGAEEEYDFAYFSITAKGNVPLGQSGLKLTKVGGEVGFNYKLNFPAEGGGPEKNNYIIGMTLGVADVANMCEVTGNAVVQFNTNTGNIVLTLNGDIDVLKSKTFFNGKTNVNYKIPQNLIDGFVSATVSIPASGYVLTTNNCKVFFNIGGGSWSANGSGMGGSMFDGVVFLSNGHINMSGSLKSPTSMSGELGGNASAKFDYSFSASAAGNTVSGDFILKLNANINANINQSGLSGSFAVTVTGNATLTLDTWVSNNTFTGSAIANGNVSYSGGGLSMSGNMDVTLPISIPFWGNQISSGFSLSI